MADNQYDAPSVNPKVPPPMYNGETFPIKRRANEETSSKGVLYTVVPIRMGTAQREIDIRDSPYGILTSVQEFALQPAHSDFSGNNLLY